MHALQLSDVTKRFGTVTAVEGVELDFDAGRFVSFLGPSGCGKTTLLRLIAGLETPTRGHIRLGGRELTAVPAHRRNIGMVFQSLALFPHLTVGDNIAYGLRVRGTDAAQRRRRVEELLELVQLPGIARRHIGQLSGGQRQRVAIARALALEPDLFLLDEPLSALDANLREAMQIELRQLQQRLGVTTIMVTHDQSEAMTLSDEVVVMSNARVQQVGPPLTIYRQPVNRFVADFIGSSNLLAGRVESANRVRVKDRLLSVEQGDFPETGRAVSVLTRPEDVHVLTGGEEGENRLPGRVGFIRDLGATIEIMVDCDGDRITALVAPRDRPAVAVGDAVSVELPAAACRLLVD